LMITWLPFPTWFILSPEGAGLVTSISVIQLGWAFLNITSKFSLIFYMQRIKDNYCNRLKVKRELKGSFSNAYSADEEDEGKEISGELSACVVETMSDLGMAYNVERFLTLLREAGVYCLDDIEKLDNNQEECESKQLPVDLISAIQRKHKLWALEMVDDAERGLEKGEKHYEIAVPGGQTNNPRKAPPGETSFPSLSNVMPSGAIALPSNQPFHTEFSPVNIPMRNQPGDGQFVNGQPDMRQQEFSSEALAAYQSGPFAGVDNEALNQRLDPLEKKMEQLEFKIMTKFSEAMTSIQKQMDKQLDQTQLSQKSVESKVEFALSTQQRGSATMENALTEKMERMFQRMEASSQMVSSQMGDVTSAQAMKVSEKSLEVVTKKMEEFQEANKAELSRLGGSMAQMMDGWAQHTIQESKAVAYTLQTKLAQAEETQSKDGRHGGEHHRQDPQACHRRC